MRIFALLVLCVAGLSACGPKAGGGGGGDDDDDDSVPDAHGGGGGDGGGGGHYADAAPAQACNKMDILFVIDDSGSMELEQAGLATAFPQFAQAINDYVTSSGETLDYRVAVTTTGRDVTWGFEEPQIPGFPPIDPIMTTELGDDGAFRMSCGMQRRWLQRDDADMAGTFACIANVGIEGPSLEMPLYAMELATGPRVADGTNGAFLREEALLAVILLTDENDCSRTDDDIVVGLFEDPCDPNTQPLTPVTHFLEHLDALKQERGRWAAAVIAGPGPGTCSSSLGDAVEATRLKDFVTQTGTNAVFASICEGNLAGALTQALDTFQAACEAIPPIP